MDMQAMAQMGLSPEHMQMLMMMEQGGPQGQPPMGMQMPLPQKPEPQQPEEPELLPWM